MLGVHVSVIFLKILASFGVTFSQQGCNVSHFNYLEVMKSNCCFFERLFEIQKKCRFRNISSYKPFLFVHCLGITDTILNPTRFLFFLFFFFL